MCNHSFEQHRTKRYSMYRKLRNVHCSMTYNEVTYTIAFYFIISNKTLLEDTRSFTMLNVLCTNVVENLYEVYAIKRVRPPFKLASVNKWNGKGRLFDLAPFKVEAFSFWGELFQPQAFLCGSGCFCSNTMGTGSNRVPKILLEKLC